MAGFLKGWKVIQWLDYAGAMIKQGKSRCIAALILTLQDINIATVIYEIQNLLMRFSVDPNYTHQVGGP